MWSGADLARFVTSNSLTADQEIGIAYGQGTLLARLMYGLANSGYVLE